MEEMEESSQAGIERERAKMTTVGMERIPAHVNAFSDTKKVAKPQNQAGKLLELVCTGDRLAALKTD